MHYIHCLWFSLMLKSQIAGVKYFLLNLVSDLEGPRSVPSALIEEIPKTIHAASSESIKTRFLLSAFVWRKFRNVHGEFESQNSLLIM